METPPNPQWKVNRKHPRIPLHTPVEVRAGHRFVAQTENVSLGGLRTASPQTYPPSTPLWVRFNLPDGHSVTTEAVVVYADPGRGMGLRFVSLPAEAERALAGFAERIIKYTRRSGRILERLHVTLRLVGSPVTSAEMAETMVLNKHGGLLITRGHFHLGDRLFLWWPAQKRGAEVRPVFRQSAGTGELIELGFVFVGVENFWEREFNDQPE